MSKPSWQEIVIEKPVACLASSLASIVRMLPPPIQDGFWYGADILLNNQCRLNEFQLVQPKRIGSTAEFLEVLQEADQFQSGVFLVFLEDKGLFLPGRYQTEDEQYRDIGHALIEIRAFDTTFYAIYGRDDETRQAVKQFTKLL